MAFFFGTVKRRSSIVKVHNSLAVDVRRKVTNLKHVRRELEPTVIEINSRDLVFPTNQIVLIDIAFTKTDQLDDIVTRAHVQRSRSTAHPSKDVLRARSSLSA